MCGLEEGKELLLNLPFALPLSLSPSCDSFSSSAPNVSQKKQASFLSSHKQRFTFKQATSSQVLRKKKPNFTTLIEPLKKNTHLFFLAQITSHNPNQLNPSADCSLQAGGQIGNVWNQYEHSRSTCRIVGVTANSTELTGCRGLISISHY